jgi:hypothetical protein
MITATNKATGEVVELEAGSLEEVVKAWQVAQEYAKTADALKDQLKKIVPQFIDHTNKSPEVGNYQFKVNSVQRMTYDKSVLRSELDEDVFDVLTKVDKPAVDKYLKENLESLGEVSTTIRQAMVADGQPYEVIKLEKLSRE